MILHEPWAYGEPDPQDEDGPDEPPGAAREELEAQRVRELLAQDVEDTLVCTEEELNALLEAARAGDDA